MVLNKNEITILEELIGNNFLKIDFLAQKINLTERSIRYKIDNLNYFLERSQLNEKLIFNKGCIELVGDMENITELISELEKNSYIFSNEDRIEYLLVKLLFSDSVKVEEVCEEIDVSRSTLKKDLRDLRKIFETEGLEIISKPRIGLILTGEEKSIRKLMLEVLLKYVEIPKFKEVKFKKDLNPLFRAIDIILKDFMVDGLDLKFLFQFLNNLERRMNKVISDEGYKIMIFYLLITLKRIKNEKILSKKIQNELFLKNTFEYSIIYEEFKNLEKIMNIEFSSKEILQFTEYFLGTHSYNFEYSFYENWIQIESLVKGIIENVNRELDVNIVDDIYLEEGLINHLRPTIYRIKNGIKLENLIYEDVIEEYPKLFFLVKKSLTNLENFLNKKIDNDEAAFITVHFKLAIDRCLKKDPNFKNILIVCGFGYGTSRLLSQSIKDSFNVNIIEIVPYNKFVDTEINKVDLIVSTLNFENEKHVPMVRVNPILTKKDIENLKHYGLKKITQEISLASLIEIIERNCKIEDRKQLEKQLKNYFGNRLIIEESKKHDLGLTDLLPLENIKITENVEKWEEAVKLSGEILQKNGYIKDSYIEDMIEIIKKSGPYMIIGKDIILPHAEIKKNVKRTGLSFLKLKKEIEFPEGNKIKNIVTLASTSREEHIKALMELKKIIDTTNFLAKLEEVKTEKEIFYLIIKLKYNGMK